MSQGGLSKDNKDEDPQQNGINTGGATRRNILNKEVLI